MTTYQDYLTTYPSLALYTELLFKLQKAVNLVAPSTIKEADNRHFIDSLQMLDYLPRDKEFTLVDMGSGAGFPGLVIACALPNAHVHLIESDQKKSIFLQTVSRETKTDVRVHNKRIEDVMIDNVDIVSARALSSLDELFSYSAKFNPETFLFMKGENADKEIKEAQNNWSFDYKSHQSITSKPAQILEVTNLIKNS